MEKLVSFTFLEINIVDNGSIFITIFYLISVKATDIDEFNVNTLEIIESNVKTPENVEFDAKLM